MRSAALIAVLACAALSGTTATARAENARESRYGPAPERAPAPRADRGYVGVTYDGPSLGWSGKREIAAPQAQAAPAPQPWWAQQSPRQVAEHPASAYAPQPQPQYQPQARYQSEPRYQPQAQDLPQPPAPRYQPLPRPANAPTPSAAAPMQMATAEPPPPVYQQPRTLLPGQVGVRTYSVGRQFGMDPDPIPAAGPTRMVMIAAPAGAPDDEAKAGDGDWPSPDKPGKASKDGER